jgi:hypothetical protein
MFHSYYVGCDGGYDCFECCGVRWEVGEGFLLLSSPQRVHGLGPCSRWRHTRGHRDVHDGRSARSSGAEDRRLRFGVSRWLRWSLAYRLGKIADPRTLDTQYGSIDRKQAQMGKRDGSCRPTLLDSRTAILYGHFDVFAEPPRSWHAGRFVVALTVQDIGDYLVAILTSKNPSQSPPAYDAAWWVKSEPKSAHRRLARKEKRRCRQYRMSRFWRIILGLSSKSWFSRADELQALLVVSWKVEVPLRQVGMGAWRSQKKHRSQDEDGVALQSALAATSDQRLVSSEEEDVLLAESH